MSDKTYTPWIVVTDAGAQDGSQSLVTDLATGNSIVVDNQADQVANAYSLLSQDARTGK
jgi:hypothetical protein